MAARLTIGLLLVGLAGFPAAVVSAQSFAPANLVVAEEPTSLEEHTVVWEPDDLAEGLSCCPGRSCGGCASNACCRRRSRLVVHNWLEQGFTWNPASPRNRFNTPVTFNDRSNEYQMNQLYLGLERAVDTQRWAWDLGGRVDLLYGTDYFFTEATGLETRRNGSPHWNSSDGPRGAGAALYGLAMPQLYAEVFAPIGHGLTVKIGHFYTIIGYESVMAPANFFYSHSYTFQYGEPFTHTGLLAEQKFSPRLAVQAGFTNGWNNWENINGKLGFLGGVRLTSSDQRTVLAFAINTGREDDAGKNNRTMYSIVLTHQLTCRLRYVLQHDLGAERNAAVNRRFESADALWYGINQYLFYELTDTTALGLRFEWFRDAENARVFGIPIKSLVRGSDYFEITLGLNWEPSEHFILRPEVRWDWSNVDAPLLGVAGMYDDFSKKSQFTLAIDLIARF